MSAGAGLDAARAVADAVLYEGYLLYPYRASAAKNQMRWQFGILGPPGAAAAGVGEEPSMQTECLLEVSRDGDPRLDVHLRFLQVQSRAVERAVEGGFAAVEELRVGPASWVSWQEAVEREIEISDLPLAGLQTAETFPVDVPGGVEVELLRDGDGPVLGRLLRRRAALTASLHLVATPVDGPYPLLTVRARLDNGTAFSAETAAASPRDQAARYSLVGTHLLLAVTRGAFISLTDPPHWAAGAAAACANARCWPVLVGEPDRRDIVLASPIILPDHPEVAPESPGALYDSTEIDEILTLRIMTLTDEEKLAARGTDPRAAAIIDRCDTMPPEIFERLHGALRSFDAPAAVPGAAAVTEESTPWWDPAADASVSPETDSVEIEGTAVAKGNRVRLRPKRRADAQDLFLTGQSATVTGVFADVDGGTHVAVVLEDDPASEMHEWYGRYYYFGPEELEPLPVDDGEAP